jgi:ribosomal protein L29
MSMAQGDHVKDDDHQIDKIECLTIEKSVVSYHPQKGWGTGQYCQSISNSKLMWTPIEGTHRAFFCNHRYLEKRLNACEAKQAREEKLEKQQKDFDQCKEELATLRSEKATQSETPGETNNRLGAHGRNPSLPGSGWMQRFQPHVLGGGVGIVVGGR